MKRRCKKCPHIRLEFLPGEHICFKMIHYSPLDIEDIRNDIVPEWCPLENKKKGKDSESN